MGRAALLLILTTLAGLLAPVALAQSRPGDPGFVYGSSSSSSFSRQLRYKLPSVAAELSLVGGMYAGEFRAANGPGTRSLNWKDDSFDDDPAVPSLDLRFAVRTGDMSRLNFWYRATFFRGFSSGLTQPVQSGETTIPSGSDINLLVQSHRMGMDYEFMWAMLPGVAGADFSVSTRLGLGWDVAAISIQSDAFTIARPGNTVRETLPYPFGGMVLEQRWERDVLRLEATAGWLPEVSTLQEYRGEKVKVEYLAWDASVAWDIGLAEGFTLGFQLGYTDYSLKQSASTLDREVRFDGPWAGVRIAARF